MNRSTTCLIFFVAVLSGTQALAAGKAFTASCYDDGQACPHGCDAHVVFCSKHNGSKYASAPTSDRAHPQACVRNSNCRICFDESDDSCITVKYQGDGPPPFDFDFTPAFFAASCDGRLPKPLARECSEYRANIADLKRRINCFEDTTSPRCIAMMKRAEAAKEEDQKLYQECIKDPEGFNRRHKPEQKRSDDCKYEKLSRGKNRTGTTWHLLLPAACAPGSFVGPNGTDCCSADTGRDACFIEECRSFFPKRP
jgi:hypothetical protein